jgi:hypothetical protein
VAALLPLVEAEANRGPRAGDPDDDDAPLAAALSACLCGSADGVLQAAALIRELPDALPLVALALAGGEGAPAVALPPALHDALAAALEPFLVAGGEAGMLALQALSRFSCGDAGMIERIVAAAEREPGYGGQVLAALAHVGRRSARAAAVLGPLMTSRDHLGATLMAVAVAGLALPVDHPLWAQLDDLHDLGTIAAAAAHGALLSRARIRDEA